MLKRNGRSAPPQTPSTTPLITAPSPTAPSAAPAPAFLPLRRAAAVLALFSGAALTSAAAAQEDFRTYDAATFYKTTSVFGASFSADESKLLMSTDQTGVFNVYAQPIAGGAPTPLTQSDTSANMSVGYFPQDDRVLYMADDGGNEQYHLYVRELDGTVNDLTPGQGLRATFFGWAGDFKNFYVQCNERDPQFMDVYQYDAKTYERTRVFENTDGLSPDGISRDGRWIALSRTNNNADSDLLLFDTTNPSAAPAHITPHTGNVLHEFQDFSPDGSHLLYVSDKDDEFMRVWAYDLKAGSHTMVEQAGWDILASYYSWNGGYRVTLINDDGRSVLKVYDNKNRSLLKLPGFPDGDITSVTFSRSEHNMAFYVNGDTSPSNLFALDLATREHRRLTNTMNPEIDPDHLVQAMVVRYESFDGVSIPALLYRPKQATAAKPAPALVWVHGGPGGQSRIGYSATIQHLVNHGYAVLAVNNRGSSGYGKTFFHLDDLRHGEDDLQDCVFGRKYLESLDWIDGGRIGIMGGSYGGYMVAAALTFTPDAFDVGINIFGVTNWLRTLKSIPPWWASFRDALYAELGNPETDEERLTRISPVFHATNITKPLLVVQGANDPRVLKAESDDIVEAARSNGVPVEYLVFDDEGHGFMNKDNRIKAQEAYLDFLDRYLRGKQ